MKEQSQQSILNKAPALRNALFAVAALCLLLLFDHTLQLISFSNGFVETAFATEKSPRKSKKKSKKRRRRARKPRANGEDKEKGSSELEAAPSPSIIGGDSAFGEKEFDVALGKSGAIDAVLLLDASRSMQRTDPDRLRDQGAKLFLRFLSEGDRLAIIQFEKETRIVTPLTLVSDSVLADIDKAIEGIPNEGNFTDLWSPIVAALEILTQEGRRNAEKAVILLSDGKMDPHPDMGTAAELVQKLRETDLPLFKEREIKLYTMALSDEADKKLLAELARRTGGLNWYAPSVNAIHKIFSDLFLTLKTPQVVALEGAGFEIDGTVSEATFYISRKDSEQVVKIIDPRGKEFSNLDFPPGVKWYRGTLFDVVTIKRPFPGPWSVKGVEEPDGFATLLTDLKLKVAWPEHNLRIGDEMVFQARLAEGKEAISTPGMKEVTFYSFKIVDSTTGQLIIQGSMNDNGEDGDIKAGDQTYSHKIKIDKEGEYKALISVTGPTFTRQQHVSFNVSEGMISLVNVEGDSFTGEEGGLRIVLSKQAVHLKSLKIQLIAQRKGEESAVAIDVTSRFQIEEGVYTAPTARLEKGEYELEAWLSGKDSRKKKVEARSETLLFVSQGAEGGEEGEGDVQIEQLEEENPEWEDTKWGLISWVFSFVWAGSVFFVVYRRSGKEGGVKVEAVEEFVAPPEWEERLQALRERVTEDRREPTAEELELFSIDEGSVSISSEAAPAEDGGGDDVRAAQEDGFEDEDEEDETADLEESEEADVEGSHEAAEGGESESDDASEEVEETQDEQGDEEEEKED